MEPAVIGQKELRRGWTTGSCAAAAAAAASQLLLTGAAPAAVSLPTPAGVTLLLEVEQSRLCGGEAVCAVRKDAGDDPDITNGVLIAARVTRLASGFAVLGGKGVGTVTRPGLACDVGQPAINPVPQAQIRQAMQRAAEENGYTGGLQAVIEAKGGEELAERTFNPRLGIEGGISILGTSGIVEPMSERALVDTICVELNSRYAGGSRSIMMCPGNYGRDFAREKLGVDLDRAVTISNYVGDAIDHAVYKGFERILLIGHAGKLIKLAAGVMQTHSAYADGRQEIFAAHAAMHGGSRELITELMNSVTVDACLELIEQEGILTQTMQSIGKRIEERMQARVHGALQIECILFTNKRGEIWRSSGASELLPLFKEIEDE